MKEKLHKCIACKGKGLVPRRQSAITFEQKKEVLRLYRTGMPYREIGRKVGIPHPQSIVHIIFYSNKDKELNK